MLKKSHFVEKLRSLGFKFKEQKPRVELWKRAGDLRYANVPRRDTVTKSEACIVLRMAGLNSAEIEAWVNEAENPAEKSETVVVSQMDQASEDATQS